MKRETELFNAVYHFFNDNGYDVRAEVNKCDVVAIKDDQIVIIELKLKLNMELILQLADRLRFTKDVYACIPKKEINLFTKKGKHKMHLLRTLGVGLLGVSQEGDNYTIKELLKPQVRDPEVLRKRNKRKQNALIKEFQGREKLSNVGGSTRVVINTAYRALATKIANYIDDKEVSTKELREHFNNPKVVQMLQKNYYGWFERVDRGIYKLTEKGLEDIKNKAD
jgi:hypothetical protein